jgi:hypothetical protein
MKPKTLKVLFWISTIFIFLFEGVMPALTSHTDLAIQGITHLGYPVYFVGVLAVFKVAGTLALIIPQVPARIKEWAYAGFVFDFLWASISYIMVDGFGFEAIFPLIVLAILIVSYTTYHKLHDGKAFAH